MAFRERDPRLLRAALFFLLLALGCLALLFAGCASSTLGKSLNVGIGVSAVPDEVTTTQGVGRGAHEANVLMRGSDWQRRAVKAMGVGAVIGSATLIERRGRDTLAHVVRAVYIAINVGVAVHNAGVLR